MSKIFKLVVGVVLILVIGLMAVSVSANASTVCVDAESDAYTVVITNAYYAPATGKVYRKEGISKITNYYHNAELRVAGEADEIDRFIAE